VTADAIDPAWLAEAILCIRNMPCGCCRRWVKDGSDTLLTYQCRRCRVLAAWDTAHPVRDPVIHA
jgi:hypothetical protein